MIESAQSWLIVQHDESGVNNRAVQIQQLQQSTTHRQIVQTSEGPSINDIIVSTNIAILLICSVKVNANLLK